MAALGKSVQIDRELFLDLYYYFFEYENAPTDGLADDIRHKLDEKIDKIVSRELFTKYKRSPTGAEREQARQEYLDFKGISQSFRSDEEIHM